MRYSFIRKPRSVQGNIESAPNIGGPSLINWRDERDRVSTDANVPLAEATRLAPGACVHRRSAPTTLFSNTFRLLGAFLPFAAAAAGTLTLQWDKNQEPDVVGYRLRQSTLSGTPGTVIDVGPKTTYTLQQPPAGVVYYFTVTAYDTEGFESDPTEELTFESPLNPDIRTTENTPPDVSNVTISTAEDVTAAITLVAADAEGDPITFIVKSLPIHGTLSGLPPHLSYTPDPNFNGTDSFRFSANDGSDSSGEAEVSIRVVAQNDAPSAIPGALAIFREQTKVIELLGADIDGDLLQFTIVNPPAHGSLSGSGKQVVYTPAAGYIGGDSFAFRVDDGLESSAPATVSIQVSPFPDRPTTTSLAAEIDEDSSAALTLRGNSPNNLPLTFNVTVQPLHGKLTGKLPNVLYVPEPDFAGVDQFAFTATDGRFESDPSTATITVIPVNDKPVATSQAVSVKEDGRVELLLNGSDAEGDSISYQIATQPKQGVLIGTPPTVTYVPNQNYSGADSFSFVTLDESTQSVPAIVSITVLPDNDAPSAMAQSLTVDEDSRISLTLGGTDPEGSRLSYVIADKPKNGVLVGVPPLVTYTPNKDFNGEDSFSFFADDGELSSAPATITVTVRQVNDAPTIEAASVTVMEDSKVSIVLQGNDIDGDKLQYKVLNPPANGTLTGTPPNLVYTPDRDFNGSDALTFSATDGQQTTAPARVTIQVTPENDLPNSLPQSFSVNEDTALSVTLKGTDIDGDSLSFKVITLPSNGTLIGTPPSIRYTPNKDFNGSDSFSYISLDGTGNSEPASVDITVLPTNDRPMAIAGNAKVVEDSSVAITLQGSDVDNDPLSFSISAAPKNGTLQGVPPNLVYSPKSNFKGTDSFAFTVKDGELTSLPAVVTIEVTPVNDAPVAVNNTVTLNEDAQISFILTGKDTENSPLSFRIISGPANGVISGKAPSLSYKPSANFNGTDSILFEVNDGQLTSAPAKVSFVVLPVNDVPAAISDSVSLNEDNSSSIQLTGRDIDGDKLIFSIATRPTRGTLTGVAPNLIYTPAPNFNGSDSFVFKVSDGKAESAPATISITVKPVNDAPVAIAKSVTTVEDGKIAILLGGTDTEASKLSFNIVTKPTRGTITGTGPYFTYTPSPNVNGTDSFTFSVTDGSAVSTPAKVNIAITPVNDTPTAKSQTINLSAGGKSSIVLSGADVDGNSLRYSLVTKPTRGTLTGTPPNLVYTASSSFVGSDVFYFSVSDGSLTSASAAVVINSTATSTRNSPKLASASPEGSSLEHVVLVTPGSDTTSLADGSTTIVNGTLISAPASGNLVLNEDGTFSFQHDGSETLSDNFIVSVSQADGSSIEQNYQVSVVRFSSVAVRPEEVVLQFNAIPSATYDVEASLDGSTWGSVSGPFVATAPVMRVTDTKPTPNGFYRLISQPDGIRVLSPIVNVTLPDVEGFSSESLENPDGGLHIVGNADDF